MASDVRDLHILTDPGLDLDVALDLLEHCALQRVLHRSLPAGQGVDEGAEAILRARLTLDRTAPGIC
ncbi:hypothetical protein [Actinomycetospora chiangmaiensis]|uniref:hypothetical protein n=1 Tax=Actinomycetospora chiangmaiensis TaxID=402650 RepID=UPI000381C857|nr:hypothetical protein [Actinomycetospora chiangmaiensis]